MEVYPGELRETPTPVGAFVGAGKLYSSVTKNLSMVSLPDGERQQSFKIIILERTDTLPKKKKARRTISPSSSPVADSGPPPGILKANWMYKHSNLIPSVVVVFFPEWSKENKWKAKEAENCALLDNLRIELRPRGIKLLVVLVQRNLPGKASFVMVVLKCSLVESVYDERFANFRKRADIDSKKILFFAKHDITVSVQRLERMMSEQAMTYYRDAAQRIKREKEKGKTLARELRVRYAFEMGYFSEFRKDTKSALKHYGEAYKHVATITHDRQRMSEIKVIADYINFKICKIHFGLTNIADAISHFERHIKIFRPHVGIAEKAFEHWEWVSRQYQVIGELLELFPSLQETENKKYFPGFYYQAAARYALKRKEVALRVCEPLRDSDLLKPYVDEEPFSLVGIDRSKQTYVGQDRSYFQNHPLEAVSEPQVPNEVEMLYRAWAGELKVNHSAQVIALFCKAYDYYQHIKANRMMLYLASAISHEYAAAKNYTSAFYYFESVSSHYRREQWWSLLRELLHNAQFCAHQLGLIEHYIRYGIELLCPHMPDNIQQKIEIQRSLVAAIIQPASPLSLLSAPLRVETEPLLEFQVYFREKEILINQPMHFCVIVKSHFPGAVRFSHMRVLFSHMLYDISVIDLASPFATSPDADQKDASTDGDYSESLPSQPPLPRRRSLLLVPEQEKLFEFELIAQENQEQLQCVSILLELGQSPACVSFRWNVPAPAAVQQPPRPFSLSGASAGRLSSSPSGSASTVWSSMVGQSINLSQSVASPLLSQSVNLADLSLEASTADVAESFDDISQYINPTQPPALSPAILINELPPNVSLEVQHELPALLNEYYELRLGLHNHEPEAASGLISFRFEPPLNREEAEFFAGEGKKTVVKDIRFEDLEPNTSEEYTIFAYFPFVGHRTVMFTVCYETILRKQTIFDIPISIFIQRPFNITFEICNREFQPINPATSVTYSASSALLHLSSTAGAVAIQAVEGGTANVGGGGGGGDGPPPELLQSLTVNEPFFLHVEITSTPPYPLLMDKAELIMNSTKDLVPVASVVPTPNARTVLENGLRYTLWYLITPILASDSICLGSFRMRWRRNKRLLKADESKATGKGESSGDGGGEEILPYLIQERLPTLKILRAPFVTSFGTV
jgi:tetratricopeptide (TPR) repeat protein